MPTFSAARVMVVDDEDNLSFLITSALGLAGYDTLAVGSAVAALDQLPRFAPDAIVLDVMLPDIDGFELLGLIRAAGSQAPVLFVTARQDTRDRVRGLTIGGDDYIPKPFSMEELLLKIKIFLKRSNILSDNEYPAQSIKIGRFNFLPEELILTLDDEVRKLTIKETELIKYFSENPNKVLNRNDILEKVWGSSDYFLGRSLDVFISRLRKYFKPDPNIKIVNLHGIGFRFNIKKENNG